MRYTKTNYRGFIKAICSHDVVPLTVPNHQLENKDIDAISDWFQKIDISQVDETIPDYYIPLRNWLDVVDGRLLAKKWVYYDETQWKHPWLGDKTDSGISYHHLILNLHDFITREVLGLSWNNPKNHDLTYQFMTQLAPPDALGALFMELRARSTYGLISRPSINYLVLGEFRFLLHETAIPVKYLCNHQNYQA